MNSHDVGGKSKRTVEIPFKFAEAKSDSFISTRLSKRA